MVAPCAPRLRGVCLCVLPLGIAPCVCVLDRPERPGSSLVLLEFLSSCRWTQPRSEALAVGDPFMEFMETRQMFVEDNFSEALR